MSNAFLITGASGFLGTIIHRWLSDAGHHTVALNRRGDGHHVKDITKPFSLNPSETYDCVIHVAGKAHVIPKSEAEKRAFYEVNFEGTKNLCHALEGLDRLPQSFIFISTVSVYGLNQGQNINESHSLDGHTPYAKSKILAEKWLRDWAIKKGVILSVLRVPLLAGPNPPGNLGAMIKGIRNGKYLSIGKANARKSMVWAEDIATVIPVLVEKGGIYNLTDGYHPSFGELEKVIAEGLGRKLPAGVPYWFAKLLALAGDMLVGHFPIDSDKLKKITSTLTFDDKKARNELGWNPSKVLEKFPANFKGWD